MKTLILRHISYNKMIDILNNINLDLIDVISSTEIPKNEKINSIINFPYDTYLNINIAEKKWIDKINNYDNLVIFQPDIRLEIPSNIVDFVKVLMLKIPRLLIIDDNYNMKEYNLSEFNEYINDFKSEIILPKRLSISISDKCNLKCEFCYRHEENSYKLMRIDDFKKIPIELLENVSEVELSGYGEVLLNPDLFKILNYLSQFRNIKLINFTTNAVLLTPHVIDSLLLYNKLNLIQISIDTLNKKNYERIRKNANFSKVIHNIKYLAENKYKNPNLCVFLKMVLNTDTISNLKSMIRFTKECEFERLICLMMNISKVDMIKKSLYFKRISTNRLYNQAKKYSKKLNVSLTLPQEFDLSIPINYNTKEQRDYINHPCSEPNEVMYIQANGDVYPCCFSTDKYGNIFLDNLNDIW
jgi:MoaA/NifB/PqqE/SkfB family radical SAM enzyme